jgi:hypothetical protein
MEKPEEFGALLRKDIEAGIQGDGIVKLYVQYPQQKLPAAELNTYTAQEYDYSMADVDEAFAAFDTADLAGVTGLCVKYSRLRGLPRIVKKLPNLSELALWGTGITRLPKWFSTLTKLKTIAIETHIHSHGLIDHLQPLTKLPNLAELFLEVPNVPALPDYLGECRGLTRLSRLSLDCCSLRAVP